MNSKRKARGKTIPGIEESFLGLPTKKKKPAKMGKRKSESIKSKGKGTTSVQVKMDIVSDPVSIDTMNESLSQNASTIKIEAFDFFHQMLNHCCGSQMFNVYGTASILKQFTPEVMKTVIYVIAENSKKFTSESQADAQTQTQEKGEECQDMEITNITSKAKRRRNQGKRKNVPDLIQPRLTSPVSNSCSPVSAAVQALMSFARKEEPSSIKPENDSGIEISKQSSSDHVSQSGEKQHAANLNVFESVSLASISSSPFLQPMSSSLMLHTEVVKPQPVSESMRIGGEKDKQEFPSPTSTLQSVATAFTRPASPSFPWVKLPNKIDLLERQESLKQADRNLPSISSILAPIGSTYTDLSFQGLPMLGITQSLASSKTVTSSYTENYHQQSNKSFVKQISSPIGVIVPGTLAGKNTKRSSASGSQIKQTGRTTKQNARQAYSAFSVLPRSHADNSKDADSNSHQTSKTLYRKILPKPNSKKKAGNRNIQQGDNIDARVSSTSVAPDMLLERSEFLLNKNLKVEQEIGAMITASSDIKVGNPSGKKLNRKDSEQADTLLSVSPCTVSALNEKEADKRQEILPKPLVSVISNIREQGFVIKGLPPEQNIDSGSLKLSKPNSSNSGKLEVASALLSMGSTENEATKPGKVVSTFNREKATFDIKESSSAQHGDILFTKTGTFQIEDIEIDPKKNKIEKDSYECGKCGRVFTSLVYLARHIKRVCPDMTLRKWRCDRCEKAFRHPFGLQQHIYTHTGERPFKCDQCAKAFYSANDLRRHARTHSGERPYKCSHCMKCFSTTISLKTHTYIHTGERPHKCPHCPKTFATSSKLSRHVVTHSDKRPFACDICIKTFNRSGDLRRHYNNVHNLEHGLLSCDQCNKLFATQKCLQNHKGTHNINMKPNTETLSESGDGLKFSELLPGNYTIKPSGDD